MTINHHPSDAVLMDYASGASSEPVSLVVATHAALCPACRADIARFEQSAGAMLEAVELADVPKNLRDSIMDRLDDPELETSSPVSITGMPNFIPEPLRSYAGKPVAQNQWRRWGSGIRQIRLLEGRSDSTVRLAKIRAGARMPQHTHGGEEFTLVLAGGYSDTNGHYLRGDVAELGTEDVHQPVADADEDCICLIVTNAPLRLKGLAGAILNPFLRN